MEDQTRETRRTECLACGHRLLAPSLTLSGMPASAQDIPQASELVEDRGVTLGLCRCPHCGLWQLDCAPVAYYRDVIRAVGLSETMRALRREDYRHMLETYGLSGKKMIECGCGRGEFMEVLKEFPAEIYATEANREAAESAAALLGKDCHVFCLFPEDPGLQIPGAPFDCFFSFNFLEHQPDPSAMLGCMFNNLAPGGYGLITVPSFEYILEEGRYYELIRDHIANYTLSSLKKLCEDCGFAILEEGRIGIGDTLRLVVRKPESSSVENLIHSACMDIFAAFRAEREAQPAAEDVSVLSEHYQNMQLRMKEFTGKLAEKGMKLALFGAGHQGFTIAATTALSEAARYIIDSAPFKQGRFAPASHLPIVPPEHFYADPVDVIMITAPGYVKEISALIRSRYADHPALKLCTIEPESWEIF